MSKSNNVNIRFVAPSKAPTTNSKPSNSPSFAPITQSNEPSFAPTAQGNAPSLAPTPEISNAPSLVPSNAPSSFAPSNAPSLAPTPERSNAPSLAPTNKPTFLPTHNATFPSTGNATIPSARPTAVAGSRHNSFLTPAAKGGVAAASITVALILGALVYRKFKTIQRWFFPENEENIEKMMQNSRESAAALQRHHTDHNKAGIAAMRADLIAGRAATTGNDEENPGICLTTIDLSNGDAKVADAKVVYYTNTPPNALPLPPNVGCELQRRGSNTSITSNVSVSIGDHTNQSEAHKLNEHSQFDPDPLQPIPRLISVSKYSHSSNTPMIITAAGGGDRSLTRSRSYNSYGPTSGNALDNKLSNTR